MVSTIKISQMTDGGNLELGKVVPGLDSGANRKFTTQLLFSETGDTADRPPTPADPTIRYNTDFAQFEYWDGLIWQQLGGSSDVAVLIARLAAHTVGDGASMIGLQNQGGVSNKTVQDMSEANFIVKSNVSTLLNGFALSTLSTGYLSVETATGNLVSRTFTGAASQIDLTNPTGLAGNTQISFSANPLMTGTGSLTIPLGTTAQRPGIPTDGMIRYNTDLDVLEFYNTNATAWQQTSVSSGTVVSVSGTLNRITSTGGTTPVIDISASYVGQTSITTLGTIATGTWQGTLISPIYGGTGVNNGASTLTLAGNLVTSGAFNSTFTMTGATNVTFPTSGTLATTSQLPTPAALTKTDDTNVTLALGGTPATALLQATSLTLGWTGTLSGTRGGTGVNNGASTITIGGNLTFSGAFTTAFTVTGNTSVTLPTSGTLATTAQLPTPAALTKTDDTNVTLTLGGTPTTALLQATSLTLGWTGLLSVPRGGSGLGSATAYAVLCGGTTSTGAFQSVASVGTSGQVLTSNGAGALPTFQSVSGSGTVNSGLINQLAWYAANGTAVSGLTTANSGVLITSGGGVPSISTTLPSGISASGMLLTSPRLITSLLDTNGNNLATVTATASAVNYMTWANAATAGNPVIRAAGSDSNVQLQLTGKGTSGVIEQGISSGANAPAGYKGEIIRAAVLAASGVALTNSTAKNITTISLTAGNWLVLGVVSLAGSTANMSQAISWSSLTSATLPDNSIRSGQSSAVTTQFNLPTAPLIVNVSATTTCYLEGYAVFVTGTVTGSGYIVAIRI